MTSSAKPDIEVLRRIYLLASLDDAQLTAMRRTMRVRSLDEGERLFDYGQPPNQFFYIASGQVKLFRTSADGSEKVIEVLHQGDTFAEAVMFMTQMNGYPVSAEAMAAGTVWAFDSATMVGLLHESTESCFKLLAQLTMRLRRHVDEIDRLTLHNATFRLATFLLDEVPDGTGKDVDIKLSMPKNVLASRLGIAPETFSRILGRLASDGLVRTSRNEIVLQDIPGMRSLVETDGS